VIKVVRGGKRRMKIIHSCEGNGRMVISIFLIDSDT